MEIQNEAKKIAVSQTQVSQLRNAYMQGLSNVVTNKEVVEQIVNVDFLNVSSPETINANNDLQGFSQSLTDSLDETFKGDLVENSHVNSENGVKDNKSSDVLLELQNDYYDLQLHVQEFGIKLEQSLQLMFNHGLENKTEVVNNKEVFEVNENLNVQDNVNGNLNMFGQQSVGNQDVMMQSPVSNANLEQSNAISPDFSEGINIFDQPSSFTL